MTEDETFLALKRTAHSVMVTKLREWILNECDEQIFTIFLEDNGWTPEDWEGENVQRTIGR